MDPSHGHDILMTAAVDDLACIEVVELVTEYLEDAVSVADRDTIERHLSACDRCTTYVDQMRQMIAAMGRIIPDDVRQSIVDQLLAVFRASRRTWS